MKTIITTLFILFSFVSFSQLTNLDLENKVYEKIKLHKKNLSNYKELIVDSSMSISCRQHSVKMCSEDNLEHIKSFNGIKGKSEIIQFTVHSSSDFDKLAQKILTNFLNSPSHKKNIEEASTLIGVGIYIKKTETVIDLETFISYEVWTTIRFF
jgi:uncharacterized protein YkwD